MKKVIFLLIFVFMFFDFVIAQNDGLTTINKTIDSFKVVLKKASSLKDSKNNDTLKVQILNKIGENYFVFLQDSALFYWQQAIDLCTKACLKPLSLIEENVFNVEKAGALGNLGVYWQQKNDSKRAMQFYKDALKILEKTKDLESAATISLNIGVIYQNNGDVKSAIDYFHKSLKQCEATNNENGISSALNNMATIFLSQGERDKSLEYHKRSLAIREKMNDKNGIAYSLYNIAAIYREKLDYTTALVDYNKSLTIWEELGYEGGVMYCYNNIGAVYFTEGNMTLAKDNYEKALSLSKKLNDLNASSTALSCLSSVFFVLKDYSKSQNYAENAMVSAKQLGYPKLILNASERLYRVYKVLGKPKLAFEMYELFIQMRDSANNEQTKKASIKTQLKYEYEKKSAADSVKNSEAQKVKDAQLIAQRASLKQEKTQRYALYGGLVLVAGFLIFVINRFRITNKQKKIIEQQKTQVDAAFEKLHEKNKEVLDSIHYAKRIQNALLAPQSFIHKNLKRLQNK